MGKLYFCHKIASATVKGETMISTEHILFYHTDPTTGVITEPGHPLEGRSVKNKILVFPGGKGSSVVQLDGMYKLEKNKTAPKGFIVQSLDTVLVSTAIIMGIPMADGADNEFYAAVHDGDCVLLDTDAHTIEILE